MQQSDDIIWQVIGHNFCAYKVKTDTSTYCKNENNVSGLCNRQSCPLANSQYATVRDVNGTCHLFVKTVERAHTPAKWWEKIPLSADTAEAQAQIEEKLQYWPGFSIGKCKDRVARMHEYQARMRRLEKDNSQPILSVVKSKAMKRDKRREERARKVANLEGTIERELVERLKKGVYGEMYNISQKAFESAVSKQGKADVLEEEDEGEYEQMREFIEAESDYSEDADEQSSDIEDIKPAKTKRPRVEIEYEEEPTRQKELVRRR